MLTPSDFEIDTLGEGRFPTPLDFDSPSHPEDAHFLSDDRRVRLSVHDDPEIHDPAGSLALEEAGPRKQIYFDPPRTAAAMVTCGGLSPGLNNVIRSVFEELQENYGVPRVLGIRNGYLGLNSESELPPIEITPEFVESIDKLGGTVLGSSRGPQAPEVMADFLESQRIDILFCIGGDGTQRGANDLYRELKRRKSSISVVGIPKTIDNDIPFVDPTFGYASSLEKAAEVIRGAHVEARNAINGIGMVKLMGRHSGAIATGASVVSQEVDFTLVPEIPFPLEGPGGFLEALENRLRRRSHAVIVVAEGAGQHLLKQNPPRQDASGNRLLEDIGDYMQTRIKQHFEARKIPISMKYFDPSYFIRSVPANTFDRLLCNQMGRLAVHAAMAGRTGMMVGLVHGSFVHVPIAAVVSRKKRMDVRGALWRAVLESTRQPRW